ncbi:helix-turn-helix domain-containing protein [Methylocaldum sp. 14B]|uniref:helix-turn-helix domain-containing protein n=1 Tax=Methylocaldum sp. 14B TaxID=1912213 RepID=UPI001F0B5CFA|nr:helix-turn-helix domain-containing protein [Methylocaldum sp. 14B]
MLPGSVEPAAGATQPPASDATLEAVERQHILSVLEKTRWVIEGPKGAARILNLHPSTLRHRMKKLGVTYGRH